MTSLRVRRKSPPRGDRLTRAIHAGLALVGAVALSLLFTGCGKKNGDTIKVGILHSTTGTMAISEKSLIDAEMMAIDEINAAGGLLGK